MFYTLQILVKRYLLFQKMCVVLIEGYFKTMNRQLLFCIVQRTRGEETFLLKDFVKFERRSFTAYTLSTWDLYI